MEKNEQLIQWLNDLIRINRDRSLGYEKAARQMGPLDVEWQLFFTRMAEQSTHFAAELTQEVVKLGGDPALGTTTGGKLYRLWMQLKGVLPGEDRDELVEICRNGERHILAIYQEALLTDMDIPDFVKGMVVEQKHLIAECYATMLNYPQWHLSLK